MSRTPTRGALRSRPAFMIVALILVAVNLRLAITSASALIAALTDSGALTPTTMVLVPAIPTAVFAVAGVSTAKLSARLGVERTVALGLVVLSVGLLIRAVPQPWIVVIGTVIATAGLAVVNILLPAVVRAHFGAHIGAVTTTYSTAMSIGAALAAAVAVPVATLVGSPSIGLAAWALPAILAVVVWLVVMPLTRPDAQDSDAEATEEAATGAAPAQTTAEGHDAGKAAKRDPLPRGTWLLAGFFAIQSLLSYILMGWIPSITIDAGLAPERAGLLLGIMMAIGAPATILVMPLTRSRERMRVGFIIIASSTIVGVCGLAFAPLAMPEVWAAFLGLGMCAFPFALVLIAGIGRDAVESARASTVIQSVGYTLATLGPLAAGALRQITGSWTPVLCLLAVGALVLGTIGVLLTKVIALPGAARRATGD